MLVPFLSSAAIELRDSPFSCLGESILSTESGGFCIATTLRHSLQAFCCRNSSLRPLQSNRKPSQSVSKSDFSKTRHCFFMTFDDLLKSVVLLCVNYFRRCLPCRLERVEKLLVSVFLQTAKMNGSCLGKRDGASFKVLLYSIMCEESLI